MKVVTFLFAILLLFVFAAFTESPDSVKTELTSSRTGSIEGTVQLASRSRGTRSGGGLYGRPARSTQQVASNDSVLVILSNRSSNISSSTSLVYLNQKNRQFLPSILPVELGQTVRIQNSDPVYHNVFSLTSPHKFDVGRRPKGEHYDVVFDKPGMVDVFCDIHSNMHAIIYVLPNNAIAWTKVASGEEFFFNDVPEGDYELTAIALGYQEIQESIQVAQDETSRVGTITLNP